MQIGLVHARGLSVLAQARSLRNCAISAENRPPTSPANTTSRALPPLPASSGHMVSLSRWACLRAIPFTTCALGRGTPSRRMGLTSVVSTANWAPLNSGRPSTTTSTRLLSSTPPTPWSKSRRKTFVRTRPPASRQMRADAVSRGNPLRPRIPTTEHAERWWPKLSRRRPHTHERAVNGSWRRNLQSNRMRKGCGSIRHEQSVGNTVKGIDARGPPCDRNNVASLFERVGSNPSQNCVSTTRDTVACHPFLGWLGSSSSTTLNPTWSDETCFFQTTGANVDGLHAVKNTVLVHGSKNRCSHFRMSLTNHFDGIRPTGPMCCVPQSDSAAAPQTS